MSFKMRKILGASALCVVSVCSEQSCFATINTVSDLKRFVYRNCWGAWASLKTNLPTNILEANNISWLKDVGLSTSIYNQIETAIADCMTVNNEFNLAVQEQKINPNAIVKFNTDPKQYNQNNWNAVVLYNYLAEAIWGFLQGWAHGQQDQCIEYVGNMIKYHYHNIPNINNYIDISVKVIKQYAEALNLYEYVKRLQKNAANGPESQFIGYCIGANMGDSAITRFDEDFKNADVCFYKVLTNTGKKVQPTPVNVKIRNGKVLEYQTPHGVWSKMSADMKLLDKKITEDETKKWNNPDLTKHTSPKKIHNLCNMYTCHVNSIITALSRSNVFRNAIKKVAETPVKHVKVLGKIFDLDLCKQIHNMIVKGVDQGKMAYSKNDGQNYYKSAHDQLRVSEASINALTIIKDKINPEIFAGNEQTLNMLPQNQKLDVDHIKAECYRTSCVQPSSFSCSDILRNFLLAISDELDAYGVENILTFSLRRIDRYNPINKNVNLNPIPYNLDNKNRLVTGGFSVLSPDGFLQIIKNATDKNLGKVLQKVLDYQDPSTNSAPINWHGWSDVKASQVFSNKIQVLPDVFFVDMANEHMLTTIVEPTPKITLQDSEGKKTYRLVSGIACLPNHFVAKVPLKDNKFYIVDDTREDGDTAQEEDQYLQSYNLNPAHTEKINKNHLKIRIAIYERCG